MCETRMKSGETNLNRLKTLVSAVTEKGSGSNPEMLTYDWTKNGGQVKKIKHGDRIFGVVQLECPKCKDRGYWLYLKYGYSGWFSEMVGHSTKGLTMPIPIENTDEQLENLVPSRLRKPIE